MPKRIYEKAGFVPGQLRFLGKEKIPYIAFWFRKIDDTWNCSVLLFLKEGYRTDSDGVVWCGFNCTKLFDIPFLKENTYDIIDKERKLKMYDYRIGKIESGTRVTIRDILIPEFADIVNFFTEKDRTGFFIFYQKISKFKTELSESRNDHKDLVSVTNFGYKILSTQYDEGIGPLWFMVYLGSGETYVTESPYLPKDKINKDLIHRLIDTSVDRMLTL